MPADTASPASSRPARGRDGGGAAAAAGRGVPLSEAEAERLIRAICFKTGPPGTIGVELEWLVSDHANPMLPVPYGRIRDVLRSLDSPGVLPGGGLLTLEPGGQVELSTAPAPSLTDCVAAAGADLAVLREAFAAAGLVLAGHGIDPGRSPARVLDLPRYAAMERYFDRRGPWGRIMMCATASTQVCVDAGLGDDSSLGYRFRWRLLHALGPVLVAAFANSPLRRGRPTGWKCTRQLVWSKLDPCRTAAPPGAEPGRTAPPGAEPGRTAPSGTESATAALAAGRQEPDPRAAWTSYAMDADVLCLRRPDGQPWAVPAGLTFRDWLRGSGQHGRPTADDLRYHLSTLFPPVRARGHLELRMIDAQPGDGWIVPLALVAALTGDAAASDAAMAAAEPIWHGLVPAPRSGQDRESGRASPWLRAAKAGLADPHLARAASCCFEIAAAALARSGAPSAVTAAVGDFAERYPLRGRSPADDVLDSRAVTVTPSRRGQP